MPYVLLYLAVEIVAVVALASWIGVGWTLLVLLLGAVVGLWLARRRGCARCGRWPRPPATAGWRTSS